MIELEMPIMDTLSLLVPHETVQGLAIYVSEICSARLPRVVGVPIRFYREELLKFFRATRAASP